MPHLISNLVEKAYTPSIARIAPKHLVRKPQLGRQPQKITNIGNTALYRGFWRFTRRWICHNHKFWYSYVVLCAIGMYQVYYAVIVGHYVRKNYHRSMEYAILREQEWEKIKPADDDDDLFDDDDEEDDEEEGAAGDEGADDDDDE
ncbi:unnamed protein product [Moneuplotes crassus]|uniref:Uncharacterized protein n=2 Tax=Euplotes crassus TaxID=5936 RepID=A0AAD1Y047_EUPCR|nr:unnamed protein product [Moneuplotes crassus]